MIRRLLFTFILTAVVAAAFVGAPPAQAAACVGTDAMPTSAATIADAKVATLCLLNDERAAAGLAPLRTEGSLEAVAESYSQAMVAQQVFAHVLPDGRTLEQRLAAYVASANGWYIGENLAWGDSPLSTPAQIVSGWMHSPPHRANILNPNFAEIGIGIVQGSPAGSTEPGATYTTDFGARGAATPPATPAPVATAEPATRVPGAAESLKPGRCSRVASRRSTRGRARQARCLRRHARR